MKRAILVLAFLPAMAGAQTPSDFAYGLALDTPPGVAFARVEIPEGVYEGAKHRDLSDMRIFNADGEVVPYAFVPRVSESAPLSKVPLRTFPLYVSRERGDVDGLALSIVRSAGGTTINVASRDPDGPQGTILGGYVVDASDQREPLVALTFAMPEASSATSMRMRIDASDDLVNWRTIRRDATLVLLQHAGQRLVRNRVEITPLRAKYLRLSWTASGPMIDFSAVTGEFGTRVLDPARQSRTVSGTAIAGREGEYEYDLGGAFPVDRVDVELTAPNSIVPATVFARYAASEPWQIMGATVFYRLAQVPAEASRGADAGGATAASDTTSPPLAVTGAGRRQWMLRLDPRSGITGATAPKLRVSWPVQEIAFAPRGRGPFVLAYGRFESAPGALPIDTLVPDYVSRRALPSGTGLARTAARVDLGGPARLERPVEAKRWALWGALALGALMLGWMAWRLSRDMTKGESAGDSKARDAGPE